MGYRGKTLEQERARALRAEGYTVLEIATKLAVSKSSVSFVDPGRGAPPASSEEHGPEAGRPSAALGAAG